MQKAKNIVSYLLFIILHLFETRESIRRKVDHGGQIVLWYWQHVINLARGDHGRSLHELNKSAGVDERQGQTKVFCGFGKTINK
jgi:hypothetical protein